MSFSLSIPRVRALFLLASMTMLSSSCSQAPPDAPKTGTVSGVVTMNDAPLSGVNIVFTPVQGNPSYGGTNEKGEYSLNYSGEVKGAMIGSHTVAITTPLNAPPPPNYKDPIAAKYNTETTLKADVIAGDNKIDFKLTK
jgi:hypothetical protein